MKTLLTILLVLLVIQLVISIIAGISRKSSGGDYWDGFFDAMFWVIIFDNDNDWGDWD
jgi:hypothetical protein